LLNQRRKLKSLKALVRSEEMIGAAAQLFELSAQVSTFLLAGQAPKKK